MRRSASAPDLPRAACFSRLLGRTLRFSKTVVPRKQPFTESNDILERQGIVDLRPRPVIHRLGHKAALLRITVPSKMVGRQQEEADGLERGRPDVAANDGVADADQMFRQHVEVCAEVTYGVPGNRVIEVPDVMRKSCASASSCGPDARPLKNSRTVLSRILLTLSA